MNGLHKSSLHNHIPITVNFNNTNYGTTLNFMLEEPKDSPIFLDVDKCL